MDRLKDPPTWLKVATTQEIDLQPWAPRQWTSTTTRWRWRCGLIPLPSLLLQVKLLSHRENTASGYLDHAFMPHGTIFPHLQAQQEAVTHRWTRPKHQMHFCATLLILVQEFDSTFKSMCYVLKNPFLKSLSISDEILSKFDIHDTPEYHQRVRKQWGLSGLISAIRPGLPGVWEFFSSGHPPQLNSVGSGVDWLKELFSLWIYHGTN